jgi:hypothetical protein
MLNPFEELAFIAQVLGPNRPEIIVCLENAARNPSLAATYVRHFQRLMIREGLSLSDPPVFGRMSEKNKEAQGIPLGRIVGAAGTPETFCLPDKAMEQHLILAGQTGTGKSVTGSMLIRGGIERGGRFLVIDGADDHVHLARFFEPEDFLVIDPKEFKINFLQPPPRVHQVVWRGTLINIMREAFFFRDGTCNELNAVLGNLEKSKPCPSFADLNAAIRRRAYKANSRRAGFVETLLNRFEGLSQSYVADALMCAEGQSLESAMIDRSACFRVGLISDDLLRNFYVNFLLKWLESYLTFNPDKRTGARRTIVVEEAHRYCNESLAKRADVREPIMMGLAREIRKCGVALIFMDQLVSLLPKQLLGNAATFIIFRLPNPSCMKAISETCALLPEQKAMLPELPKRQAVVYSSELDQPYLIETLDFPLERMSDACVREKMRPALEALPFVPLPTDEEAGDVALVDGLDVQSVSRRAVELKPRRAWNDLLNTLLPVKFKTLTRCYEDAGIDAKYGRKLLNEMAALGLVELVPLNFGKKGSPSTFVLLKEKAAKFLGIAPAAVRLSGKGGPAHVIAQNLLARTLIARGENALVEHFMNEKSADVAVIGEEGTAAYEIETEPNPHVAENVRRDLEAGFVRVVVVSANAKHQNENQDLVYRSLDWTLHGRVEFRLMREFT